jgi:Flp pilus assembly protein TadG
MRLPIFPFFPRLHRDRRGAIAMLTAAVIVALAGVGAVAVDVGYAVNAQRQLQASTDAAALAGARDIGSTTNDPVASATSYSAVAGNKNAPANLTVTMASGYPALKCFTSIGVTCVSGKSGVPSANGIQVKQQASVRTFFGNAIGVSSLSIAATATAGAKGGKATPMDVMIIVDTTASMNSADSSCSGATRIACALGGVQAMLSGFWPSQDQVGLLAFPGMTSATVSKDYTCPTSNPTIVSYGNLTPAPVYQIVGLSTDYKTSDATTTLNSASNIVKAVGGATGCSGIKAPGGEGTFYADAITAAQLTLTTTGRVGVQKAIIMVTDGDASASAPSQITNALGTNECHEAITAAQVAKTAGTWVYTVSYGSPSSGCGTDNSPSITPCAALLAIASDPTKFYADTTAACPAGANATSGLTNLFQNIGTSLTSARMLPDNTN